MHAARKVMCRHALTPANRMHARGGHLEAAAEKTRCWRTPSQNSRPFSLGVFQVWLPITSSGESVFHPSNAALSGGSAPLQASRAALHKVLQFSSFAEHSVIEAGLLSTNTSRSTLAINAFSSHFSLDEAESAATATACYRAMSFHTIDALGRSI